MSNKHYTLQDVLGPFNVYRPIEQDKEELEVFIEPKFTLEMRYLGKKLNDYKRHSIDSDVNALYYNDIIDNVCTADNDAKISYTAEDLQKFSEELRISSIHRHLGDLSRSIRSEPWIQKQELSLLKSIELQLELILDFVEKEIYRRDKDGR